MIREEKINYKINRKELFESIRTPWYKSDEIKLKKGITVDLTIKKFKTAKITIEFD